MNKQRHIVWSLLLLLAVLTGCGQQQAKTGRAESKEAKQLLQGLWMDEETETVVFRMKGDTVYYADSTSMPAYFKVVGDSLFMGVAGYRIEKQTAHVLRFRNQTGETMRLVKTEEKELDVMFDKQKPQILTLTEVLKRDTVVFHDGERYHCYVAINPTRYKVVRRAVNEEGMDVQHVYYDNIIHISIFKGARQLFSRDFRKQNYQQKVPGGFLQQAVLNDMMYGKTDAQGFHFSASLCVPDEASCYLIDNVISFDGNVTTRTLE